MTYNPEMDTPAQDTRTPHQKAVDMAWRAERIDHLLRERGATVKADLAAKVMLDTLLFLDPSDTEGAEVAITILGSLVDECDGYDSGARKYEQPPELGSL